MTDRLRLAIVGCGRVVERFHQPALRVSHAWTVVGAVDVRPARLRWIAGVLPGVPVAESLAALPDAGSLDAVLVATPPASHCPLGAEVLRRGAHLLMEKPLALQPGEAGSLVALARETRRQIWVGFNRRFRGGYRTLRRRLGQLPPGRLRSVEFDLHTDPRRWDAVTRSNAEPEQRGGLLDDLASHQLDLVPWLLQRPVEAVRARYLRREPAATVVEIGLRFSGGIEARCRSGHGTRQAEHLVVDLGDRALVASPGGLVSAPPAMVGAAQRWLTARASADAVRRRLSGRGKATLETIRQQHDEWAAALRGSSPATAADGLAGARCLALTEAARHSLAGGGAWVSAPADEDAA
ncbi:MAG TPA: Gfo/Idh/MocA family oxidoreductase [Gemmatimonadales bacterium]|nr:Gfo/Idh/MocA family oxidoreductase [Gemmatimonadales bacterium]